jgi:phospholipase/carboxylesterase
MAQILQAVQQYSRAQEVLFSLRRDLPSVNRFFLEAPVHERVDELDPEPPPGVIVGLNHVGMDEDPYARGSFSFYVLESYDGSHPWPLVVALHGAYSHGRDFIWTWLREARSRRFLLLAPSSRGTTWSFKMIDVDATALSSMIEYVSARWSIDPSRILLTGISDGASYALICGLRENSPFTAFAPIAAGAVHPSNFQHARGRRIYWVHGALDWMFPVQIAQQACTLLKEAGADVTLQVIEDLSHAYPREENDRILTWFDPALTLPASD